MTASPATKRCAVYTRKSSEQGLEQDFNSLDAQREAAMAYIASQKHEGWKALTTHYDDGGWSGGNLDRPALQTLLSDIEAGKVDVVVVYKVDRLTRSLADFAKLIEVFDRKGVSFVSVTQQFNTTSSMGRLTLNVLLSFAQFEREVTGERIRDKVLASKRKGIFMGGNPPLGYDIANRRLNVNLGEAEQVRESFQLYLQLGCVGRLRAALAQRGLRSKAWISSSGRSVGGNAFSKGALYHLLKNRIYLGETTHKGKVYPGEHEAIVPWELFEAVQKALEANRLAHRSGRNARSLSLLRGLIEDDRGRPMTPSHTNKSGQRYRYYVSAIEPGSSRAKAGPALRLPAAQIEGVVRQALMAFLASANELASRLGVDEAGTDDLDERAGEVKQTLAADGAANQMIREVVRRVRVRPTVAEVELDGGALKAVLGVTNPPASSASEERDAVIRIAAPLVRHSARKQLLLPSGCSEPSPQPNTALIAAIAQAYAWRIEVEEQGLPLQRIAQRAGLSRSLVSQRLALAYLAPDLIEAILDGQLATVPPLEMLSARLPLAWDEQRRHLQPR